jgi:hypothetical protein
MLPVPGSVPMLQKGYCHGWRITMIGGGGSEISTKFEA